MPVFNNTNFYECKKFNKPTQKTIGNTFIKPRFASPLVLNLCEKHFPSFFNTTILYINFFSYFCLVVRSEAGWAEGGRQTYIKGVESTSYLRLSESRKFKSIRTIRQCSMSIGLYIMVRA